MNDPKWHRRKAIHEFCIECMGGSEWVGRRACIAAARSCPATGCPLWHFRPGAMGVAGESAEAILAPDDAPDAGQADQGEVGP